MSEETASSTPSNILNTDESQNKNISSNIDNNQSTTPSPSIRKDLVDHAVNFLTDSRVVNASDEKKRSFLKSKGMTDEEIEHAFSLASKELKNSPPQYQQSTQQSVIPQNHQVQLQQPVESQKLKSIEKRIPSYGSLAFLFLIVFGIGSAISHGIKYAFRFWFPKRNAIEERIEESYNRINKLMEKVEANNEDMKDSVEILRTFIENHIEEDTDRKHHENLKRKQDSNMISEIKKDVSSIKFLLPTSGSVNKNAYNNQMNDETTNYTVKYPENDQIFRNWADVETCKPKYYHEPTSIEEIIEIVKYAKKNNQRIRVIGSGHSPSNIAFCDDHLISLKKYNKVISLDNEQSTLKVQAGITLNEINVYLEQNGYGLPNLGSISDQTIAGAIATGTHGTGIEHGILATNIVNLQIVNGVGECIDCSEKDNTEIYKAALCNIGSLGIITEITLKCEKLKILDSIQYPMSLQETLDNVDEIIHSSEHSRFWWFPHTDNCVVWFGYREKDIGKLKLTPKEHLQEIAPKYGKNVLESLLWVSKLFPRVTPYINRLWFNLQFNGIIKKKDVSYKVFNFDCLFKQYVTEWSIPIENTREALERLKNMINEKNFYAHFPVEVRFVKGDDIYISPCYGRDSCFIGIIMYRPFGKDIEYKEYFREFEKIMQDLDGRPHWAKVHNWTSKEAKKSFPCWDKFLEVKKKMDPFNIFSNKYTEQLFGVINREE